VNYDARYLLAELSFAFPEANSCQGPGTPENKWEQFRQEEMKSELTAAHCRQCLANSLSSLGAQMTPITRMSWVFCINQPRRLEGTF
jgi:hypothetical protein